MDAELHARIDALEKKIDAVYISAEKTRKYFLWVLVATLIAFVLPLIGLLFALPSFFSVYGSLGDLGL
jgi:hypothetical protein